MSPPDFTRRIPQLDGLRGVAIAMVVVFHYVAYAVDGGAPRALAFIAFPAALGWSGVELFFVLSGFLIGGALIDARESSTYFRTFYFRRACRIFPLYFSFLAIVLIAIHFLRPLPLFDGPSPWRSCLVLCQNFWVEIQNKPMARVLNPTWSLAVEEQLYLTLPALVYFVRPARLPFFLFGGIIAAPLVRLSIFLINPHLSQAMTSLLPCKMDAPLLGITAAFYLRKPKVLEVLHVHRKKLWIALEIFSVGCGFLLFRPQLLDPLMTLGGCDFLDLMFTCILVTCLVDDDLGRVLRAKWLMGLGSIAYGVYLLHSLLFGLAAAALKGRHNSGALAALVALPLTLLIAKASWQWFEKPLVKLGHRLRYEVPGRLLGRSSDLESFTVSESYSLGGPVR
jgi:peptidoglycan/LPS O-acetylase OafA/YrhL